MTILCNNSNKVTRISYCLVLYNIVTTTNINYFYLLCLNKDKLGVPFVAEPYTSANDSTMTTNDYADDVDKTPQPINHDNDRVLVDPLMENSRYVSMIPQTDGIEFRIQPRHQIPTAVYDAIVDPAAREFNKHSISNEDRYESPISLVKMVTHNNGSVVPEGNAITTTQFYDVLTLSCSLPTESSQQNGSVFTHNNPKVHHYAEIDQVFDNILLPHQNQQNHQQPGIDVEHSQDEATRSLLSQISTVCFKIFNINRGDGV
jgi:hypothetical protein